jgi:hypothetical protein
MKMKKVYVVNILAASTIFILSGCSSSLGNLGKSTNFQESQRAFTKAEFRSVYDSYENVDKNKTNDLLFNYDAGTLGYYIKEYEGSVSYFDKAEELIKKYDKEVLAATTLANAGSLFTNDTFLDYRPRIYEKIMVNTYKGIDFLLMGDFVNARIEFNRALVRQERAKEFFKAEIEKKKQEIRQESEKKLKEKTKKNVDVDSVAKVVKNKRTNSVIEQKYSNLFAFKPYPDFVNPFSTYLAGIYFLNRGDYNKATDLLKESYGMIKGLDEGDSVVYEDFKLADRLKSSIKKDSTNYTWVIFMNGVGPIKKERRIDIPLFLFTSQVHYTGIALPTLKERGLAFANLQVKNKLYSATTKRVASMDRIIKTEFKKRFPAVVERAVARTAVQTIIQYELQKHAGYIGGIIGALYQAAFNRADTRIWEKLPKEFQVARVKSSENLQIVSSGGVKIADTPTTSEANYMVLVTIPTQGTEPLVSYQKF